jgi:O-acetyl-ADP-ribose deacetylase (regulator of RNase III)
MAVIERRGDLFKARAPALAHGCNCAGAMGKGIALEFRKRWPDMFERYREMCRRGQFQPGDVFVWTAEDRVIFNLGTQRHWRTKATREAIAQAVHRMSAYALKDNIDEIATPRIGAGQGGLPWRDVRAILDDEVPNELRVVVYHSSPAT